MRKSHTVTSAVVAWAAGFFLLVGGCGPQRQGPVEDSRQRVVGEPNAVQTATEAEDEPAEADIAAPKPAAESSVTEGGAVRLALRFAPGQTTTFKMTREAEKSVEWRGDTSGRPAAFQAGRTGHHTEMTFEQQVEHVDEEGNATLEITIRALKYVGRARDAIVLDFDSARQTDQSNPMAKLIGQSYGLEMSPRGQVLAVTDVESARQALPGNSPEQQTALRLLDESVIKARHEVPALIALPTEDSSTGQRWSAIESLNFGMMGPKEFERIYTLQEIQTVDGDRIAVVEMNAIPSSALALEQRAQQPANVFTRMFDNKEDYDGSLQLSLGAGEIVTYVEHLRLEWVAVDPAAAESATANPAVLKMGATQLHRLDRIQ